MADIRLCIVGGGSSYAILMLRSMAILAEDSLKGSSIVLMDRDPRNLKVMADFGRLVVKKQGIDLKIEDSTDLMKSLDGADFALTTFRSGGHRSTMLDETIPIKHGILGQETTGISGTFMAMRCVSEVIEVAQAMEKACPNAWLINYTNPTNFAVDAVRRRSSIRTIGLCDGVYAGMRLVAQLVDMPVDKAHELDFHVAGVNHCTWAMRIGHNGKDLYPDLPDLVKKFDKSKLGFRYQLALRIYEYFGIMPGSAAYTRYYYNLQSAIGERIVDDYSTLGDSLAKHTKTLMERLSEKTRNGDGSFGDDIGDLSHGDQAIGVINAIANDTREIQTVDVENNGAIENLPKDAIVEVAGIVGRHGAFPLAVGSLPKQVYGVVRSVMDHEELSVDAALSGDRKKVIQAVMAHPVVRSLDEAEKAVEELFAVHKEWLPQFK